MRPEETLNLDFLNGCHHPVHVIDLCNKIAFDMKMADAFGKIGNVKKAMEIRRAILRNIEAAKDSLDFLRDSLPEDAQ